MFLARHEMLYEKLRYSLMIAVISLISFLIFIISALALGLANENTEALSSWPTKQVLLSKDANGNMGQSLLSTEALKAYPHQNQQAQVGITPTTLKGQSKNISVQYIGLKSNEYIYQDLKLSSGHKPKHRNEIVVSDKLTQYQLGSKVKLGVSSQTYTIVGKARHAQYNMAPVVYGNLSNWAPIKGVTPNYGGSGIIVKDSSGLKPKHADEKVLSRQAFLNKMPGYAAQNKTFILMIVFLVFISLIVITIFLYILTKEKLNNFAVLRAQGVPNRYLLQNTLGETFIMLLLSVGLASLLAVVSAMLMPKQIPLYFDWQLGLAVGLGILSTGLLGSLIPMRMITKVDPVSAIGG
ncbi:putative ABC transport system permease protein [Weissella uvarum]|uniref:ABC transporter permease n=1 Tax=Weissella uvarum TaxID=1479233 RepID=UPI00195F7CCD|nr:ABC transporter permease [Weissella uvarum]MBM7616746.1 putative ABC transport system permease protein [Weissella uvarum]MCM0594800.1 ABC transporter permease [Weissella uvarum]